MGLGSYFHPAVEFATLPQLQNNATGCVGSIFFIFLLFCSPVYKVTRCRRRSTGKGRPERALRLIPEVVKMLAGVIVEEEFDKEQELWYSRKELEHGEVKLLNCPPTSISE